MLYWVKLFSLFFLLGFFSFFTINFSLFYLLLHSEVLIIILFFLFLTVSIIFSINYLIGLAFTYLVLGGMELALNLLILIM